MPSPYRESDNTPAAPLAELEWRRRVGTASLWAELLVAGEVVALLETGWLPARFTFGGAMAWFVLGVALAIATWLYTAPRPRSAVGWRGWLLRASVPAFVAAMGSLLLGMHLERTGFTLGVLLLGAAFTYSLPFRRPQRRRLGFGKAMLYVAAFTMFGMLTPPIEPDWRAYGLALILGAAGAPWDLRRTLLPVDREWWFDNQTGTPGEWVALLVYRDEYAQVVFIDERPGWFVSKDEAKGWLEDDGYLPAERALAEQLVDNVPPDVLPVARRRKRVRVQKSEPRVRVAADADTAEEALHEHALDETEPARAVAVHTPDE